MGLVTYRTPLRRQPLVSQGLDFNNPRARGLIGAFVFNEAGGTPRNLALDFSQQSQASFPVNHFNNPPYTMGLDGPCIQSTSGFDWLDTGLNNLGYAGGTIICTGFVNFSPTDSAVHYIWGTTVAGTFEISFQKYSDNNVYVGWTQGANNYRISYPVIGDSAATMTQNTWHTWALTWNTLVGSIWYHNGNAAYNNSTPPGVTSGSTTLALMNSNSYGVTNGIGAGNGFKVSRFLVYNRSLRFPEIVEDYERPYELFLPPARRLYTSALSSFNPAGFPWISLPDTIRSRDEVVSY